LPLRWSILVVALIGLAIFAWFRWRAASSSEQTTESSVPVIARQPGAFATRTFDPASPPPDMPPLAAGENAVCDTNFQSNAIVSGKTRQTDATHATVTITQIKVTLGLNVTIWVPTEVSPHVAEHEEGHRQISEYYYQTADQVAARVAETYMGKQTEITGTNLDAESTKWLQQMAADITEEYDKELNPEPTQLLYDTITDHSRNEVVAKDAVAHALKNVAIESAQP
jgi:hypothetical protein